MCRQALIRGLVAGVFSALVLAPASIDADHKGDLEAARELFEAHLDAIRQGDRDAYLSCYLNSEQLARTGPEGLNLGFEEMAATAGDGWPEVFEAQDLQLVPIEPGVVYGTYRYRVRFDGVEQIGLSERLFVETDKGWRIAVTTAFPAPLGTPPPPRVLVGATLIDGTGAEPVADAVILMRNGRIDCAGTAVECQIPAGVERLDVAGHWVTPGLVDSHVHFSQTGWADGRPDFLDVRESHPYEVTQAELRAAPERFFRSYLCSGVTAVFDNGGYPWTWGLGARTEADSEAPHLAAAGPLISTLDHWLNLPAERQFMYLADEETGRNLARYVDAHSSAALKIWFIALKDRDFGEMEAAVLAAGEEAAARDLPLIVHATEQQVAKVALRAGAHLLVHSVWDEEVDDEFISLAKAAGTIYCPTLTVASGYVKLASAVAQGAVPEIDDPNQCIGPETRRRLDDTATLPSDLVDVESLQGRSERTAQREQISDINLRKLHEAGIVVVMGTDAGNPLTLHGPSVYAEMEAMQKAGMTPAEVLVASTRNGALAMGRAEDFGTLEKDKIADLVVLAENPLEDISHMRSIRFVVRGGVLRPIEELSDRAQRSE